MYFGTLLKALVVITDTISVYNLTYSTYRNGFVEANVGLTYSDIGLNLYYSPDSRYDANYSTKIKITKI
jgi:hypothetical protein